METPNGMSAKPPTALQRCKSGRTAVTIWPSWHLAKAQGACYIRFARYEDKSISSWCCRTLRNAAGWFEGYHAAPENAGPLRPDFSEPKYAHIEYIWVSKGGYHADRWNLRSR